MWMNVGDCIAEMDWVADWDEWDGLGWTGDFWFLICEGIEQKSCIDGDLP